MKRILFVLIAVLGTLSLRAAQVDRSEAREWAAAFLQQPLEEMRDLPYPHLYIFRGENGFVVMPVDDRVTPLLAYSNQSPWSDAVPDNVRCWLAMYEAAVESVVKSAVEATEEVKAAWNALREGALPYEHERDEVKPLIATRWGQHAPYNEQCPENCCTGCVATVMAQLMKYWEHPRTGNGSHSYIHPTYGTQTAVFSSVVYDWDNMPYTAYSTDPAVVRQSVSTLMRHCGVAVDMNYDVNVSLAVSANAPEAMQRYFRYNPGQYVSRSGYDDATWTNMLKEELNAGRPVYYTGRDEDSGHAFICDGYEYYNHFHFNWGWDGYCDGYFYLGSLNIAVGSYNLAQTAIFGLEPMAVSINAPANLSATLDERTVSLSWGAVAGASYYKVYRDGLVVDKTVSSTSWVEKNAPCGEHSYCVRAVNSQGDRSRRSNEVRLNVPVPSPVPINVTAVTQDDDLLLSWETSGNKEAQLGYGTGAMVNHYGYSVPCETFWAQRFPASMIADYADMGITTIRAYLEAGTYTIRICKGNPSGVTEVQKMQSYTCSGSTQWRTITLSSAVHIDYRQDLWIVFSSPASIQYPAYYCNYTGPGVEDASYMAKQYDKRWVSKRDQGISWMMELDLTNGPYTYRLSRNGSMLFSGLSSPSYSDRNLASGTYTYQVSTSYYGGITEPTSYTVSVARIKAGTNLVNGGTVIGAGLYKEGAACTLTAKPNANYKFLYWQENGVTVNTNASYTFTVNGERGLVACFRSSIGVEEQEQRPFIHQMEVFDLRGALLETRPVEAYDVDFRLEGYAKGVYVIRLTTDEGVAVKKVVWND